MESCVVFLQPLHMQDLVLLPWVWAPLLVLQRQLLPVLQFAQPLGMRRLMIHQRQPRGAPWNDSTGVRGSRSLLLPLRRPRRTPQVGGLPTFYTAPDFSTIDKNWSLPAIFVYLGVYEMCWWVGALITKAQSSFCTKAQTPTRKGGWQVTEVVPHRLGPNAVAMASVHSAQAPAP